MLNSKFIQSNHLPVHHHDYKIQTKIGEKIRNKLDRKNVTPIFECMKVYKFGGASSNSIDRIRNIAKILKVGNEKILVVLSAMGKTTNALEKVSESFFEGKNVEALHQFKQIKQDHLTTLKSLVTIHREDAISELEYFFTEVEWLLHDTAVKEYSYYYDQIVCAGELMSTCIISWYLREAGIYNELVDVRDIFRTDDNFQDAALDLEYSKEKTRTNIIPLFEKTNIVITQGFIGATDENESTTLGREGSDYSAAVFANLLDADSLTIWKDVQGVMNADPKEFEDAIYLPELSYAEVIEMAYYGAQVIHPKTIKPLENKCIPLHVKCFLDPEAQGTIISNKLVSKLPTVKIVKNNQVLISLYTTDFSFVGEKPISRLYEIFAELKIRPNLVQTTAISLLCCIDEIPGKIDKFASLAAEIFQVQIQRNLTLMTVRHYKIDMVEGLARSGNILLEQRTKETIQLLMQ